MTLVFFRLIDGEEHFYPMEMPPDMVIGKTAEELARENAECNPGTIRVESTGGVVLWREAT